MCRTIHAEAFAYGYGWFVETKPRRKIYHEGGDPGFRAFEARYPDEKLVVIETIRHLYIDIDRNGPMALDAMKNSGLVPGPNYVLETSPEKYQVVWKVEGIAQEQTETLQKAMVREFGGDPAATDSTRVLRLPSFSNRKYETEYVVEARAGATQIYHLDDFKLRMDSHDDLRIHHVGNEGLRTNSQGDLSQSERDWAFAKRALARGDDAEVVIRRIADYRVDDKHDSEYYARHTVMKAQVDLGRKSSVGESPRADRSEPSERALDL